MSLDAVMESDIYPAIKARLRLTHYSIGLIKDNPLLGVGIGNFAPALQVRGEMGRYSAVHNSYTWK